MLFLLKYFCNPTKPRSINPKILDKNDLRINKSLKNLSDNIKHPTKSRYNADRNAKQIIRSYSIDFGFKYYSFMNDNFRHPKKHYYVGKYRVTPLMWVVAISKLKEELLGIRHTNNVSTLIKSKYHSYVQISNVQQFYHPRKVHLAKNHRSMLSKLSSKQRYTFVGTFMRIGLKSYHSHYQLTMLLIDIKLNNKLVTHHIWLNMTKALIKLGQLIPGNRIQFNARIKSYLKGYIPNTFHKKLDYELSYPSHCKVLGVDPKCIKLLPHDHDCLIGYATLKNHIKYNDGKHPYLNKCVKKYKGQK